MIPHGLSTQAVINFSVAQSPIHTPWQEYLITPNLINQHFLAHPIRPVHGELSPPHQPGMGMELDSAKIETETEVFPA